MSSFFRTAFKKAAPNMMGSLMKTPVVPTAMWAFPAFVGAAWFIWPALDQEWLIEMGLAKEPDLHIKAVQAAKEARMAAKKKAAPAKEEEPEEEDEPEEDEEATGTDAPEEEEETSGGSDEGQDEDEEGEEESGGDDGGDDDDDEEEESPIPSFTPLVAKAEGKTNEEIWDNFTLKSIRTGEDDDDEEDDDDDDDDDE